MTHGNDRGINLFSGMTGDQAGRIFRAAHTCPTLYHLLMTMENMGQSKDDLLVHLCELVSQREKEHADYRLKLLANANRIVMSVDGTVRWHGPIDV